MLRLSLRGSLRPSSSRLLCPLSKRHASVLFALSSLSNSRETQHFNKITRLPRVEHSPSLKLIKQSEVDPYPLPEPGKPRIRAALPSPWPKGAQRDLQQRRWDEKALKVGQAVLADNARRERRLKLSLRRLQQKAAKQASLRARERLDWQKEHSKLQNEIRTAGLWIVASIGTATALAMWRFWPQQQFHMDSAELGRRVASRARAAMPLPSIRGPAVVDQTRGNVEETMPAQPTTLQTAVVAGGTQQLKGATNQVPQAAESKNHTEVARRNWWQQLFWKQV